MEMMGSALRDELHALIDELPEDRLEPVREILVGPADERDPFSKMPEQERAELHADLDASEREFEAGLGMPADEVLRELRASR